MSSKLSIVATPILQMCLSCFNLFVILKKRTIFTSPLNDENNEENIPNIIFSSYN